MSYVLNKAGFSIPSSPYAVVSGDDKKKYMYRVNDMIQYLNQTFGTPDLELTSPKLADFKERKGIIVFTGDGWSNARGHVTLWNGSICSDACHFRDSPFNGTFVPNTAYLWELE